MNDQKRMILAVVLLFVVLTLYPKYMKWISPPQPESSGTQQTQTVNVESAASQAPAVSQAAANTSSQPVVSKEVRSQEEFYDLATEDFRVTFSNLGGTIKHLEARRFSELHGVDATLVDIEPGRRGSYALLFPFEKSNLDLTIFKREKTLEKDSNVIAFSAIKDGTVKVIKVFTLLPLQNAIELQVVFENIGGGYQELQYELSTQMSFSQKDAVGRNISSLESGVRLGDENKIKSKNIGRIAKNGYLAEGDIDWSFASKKYFALITDPDQQNFIRSRSIKLNQNEIANYSLLEPMTLAPGLTKVQSFLIYAGAKEYTVLKEFDQHFEGLFSKGFFGTFRVWLLLALQFLFKGLHNWGWAIIAITVIIKLAFTPLTHMSFASMNKMKELQPKIKAIQDKYKSDPQQMNKEVMAFYKKNKVNPLGGCLPMLLQMPIFIAFYQVLYQAIELKGAPWIMWVTDLSAPDKLFTLPFSLPFLGDGLNILPLLMTGSMVWQQKLTPAAGSPEQAKMMMMMPIIFGFIFYNLPSGLVLYWTVNNVLTIFHQTVIKKAIPAPHAAE